MDTKSSPESNEPLPFQIAYCIADITKAICSNLDLASLIKDSIDLIRHNFSYLYIHLYLLDDTKEWAVIRAGAGETGKLMVEQGYKVKIDDTTLIGRCILNRIAYAVADGDDSTVEFRNRFSPETSSAIALPLISQNRVIGVLEVQDCANIQDDTEDVLVNDLTLLKIIVDHLAVAIENARIVGELKKKLESLNEGAV